MRKGLCCLAALLLCFSLHTAVLAETYSGPEGWRVVFTEEERLQAELHDVDTSVELQPGDSITYTVSLVNRSGKQSDWYLSNEVLHALEDRGADAFGGTYGYRLACLGPDGEERVLYASDTVGGDVSGPDGPGLHEATASLKDYLYCVTLEPGQRGTVTLALELDGETLGNAYQNTFAELRLRFAVSTGSGESIHVVDTGDHSDGLLPLYLAMGGSGIALLVILTVVLVRRRRAKGGPAA